MNNDKRSNDLITSTMHFIKDKDVSFASQILTENNKKPKQKPITPSDDDSRGPKIELLD